MVFMKMKEYYFIALIIKVIYIVSSEWGIYKSYGGNLTISIKLIHYEFGDFNIEKAS